MDHSGMIIFIPTVTGSLLICFQAYVIAQVVVVKHIRIDQKIITGLLKKIAK